MYCVCMYVCEDTHRVCSVHDGHKRTGHRQDILRCGVGSGGTQVDHSVSVRVRSLKHCRYVCMYVPLLIECRVFFSRYIPHPMIVSQIFALLGLYKAAHFRQEWPYVVPIHITMYLIHMLQVGILSSLTISIHTYTIHTILHIYVIHTYIHW